MTDEEFRTFKGKELKLIAVVPRDLLFNGGISFFEGFKHYNTIDSYSAAILNSHGFMTRGNETKGFAEKDTNYKQPIAYCAVVNSTTQSVFVYERAPAKADYQEDRLRGLLSLGIGGHIDYEDGNNQDIIQTSMLREIEEEVNFGGIGFTPRLRGYINIEHGVHAVHFGIFYIIETGSENVKLNGKEGHKQRFVSISELEDIANQFEEWSQVVLPDIKEYLESNHRL